MSNETDANTNVEEARKLLERAFSITRLPFSDYLLSALDAYITARIVKAQTDTLAAIRAELEK